MEVRKNGAVTTSYTYDTNGNRLSATTPAGTTSGTFDAQDRLTQYGNTTYAYTASGELQSKTVGGQTTTYQYDQLGNLITVGEPSGTQITYLVGGQNRRIGKQVNGVLTQGFLYQDALRPVAELDGANHVVSRFVYGSRTNVPDYVIKGANTYRILADQVGSVRLVVDTATGQVLQRLDYDEFGNVTQDTNPGFQPFGFAGGLYDRDTKLTRFGARDYDPEVGRWTSKDPNGFGGDQTNLYSYSYSDPINFADPDGRVAIAAVGILIVPGVGELVLTAAAVTIVVGFIAYEGPQIYHALSEKPKDEDADVKDEPGSCPNEENLLKKPGHIADELGFSVDEINDAIHEAKKKMPKTVKVRNADVGVDPNTGEIYPIHPETGPGDSIGNIFDFLK